jgi:hypothetical protein
VSFSGGKDSAVLADLAARVCKITGYKLILWFSDTGLEFPEVRNYVKTYRDWLKQKYDVDIEIVIDYPKDKKGKRIKFRKVIEEYGYPIVSKEVSQVIEEARKHKITGKYIYRVKRLNGELLDKNGNKSIYNCEKWKFLLDSPFLISNKCCSVMKKNPSKKYEKETGFHSMIGTMACESQARKTAWKLHDCNAFNGKRPCSQPLSFWTEQDILQYIKTFNIPIASVYGEVLQDDKGKYYTTGVNRTGCVSVCLAVISKKNRIDFNASR